MHTTSLPGASQLVAPAKVVSHADCCSSLTAATHREQGVCCICLLDSHWVRHGHGRLLLLLPLPGVCCARLGGLAMHRTGRVDAPDGQGAVSTPTMWLQARCCVLRQHCCHRCCCCCCCCSWQCSFSGVFEGSQKQALKPMCAELCSARLQKQKCKAIHERFKLAMPGNAARWLLPCDTYYNLIQHFQSACRPCRPWPPAIPGPAAQMSPTP